MTLNEWGDSLSPSEQMEQLELELWRSCNTGYQFPLTADRQHIQHTCETLARVVEPLSLSEQMELAGEILVRLSETLWQRTNQFVEAWEQRYNPIEPSWDEELAEFLDGLTIKTTSVDADEFVLPTEYSPYPEYRKSASPSTETAAEEVESLLPEEDLSEPPVLTPEEVRQQVERLAHDEDIQGWSTTVCHYLRSQSCGQGMLLLELVGATGLSLVEVWLALLLGNSEYGLVQSEADFYRLSEVRVVAWESLNG